MGKLLQHYENLLNLASLTSTADGVVRRKAQKDVKVNNLFISGKPVVLPTYEQLNSQTISDKIVFHPFAESSSKGESQIVAELRSRFCASMSMTLMSTIMKFVEFGASKAEHRKLNPIQSEMLDCVRKIDEKDAMAIADFFVKILKMPDKKNASLIQIYLSRHGRVGDKEYARAGIVSFPLYNLVLEELEKTKERSIEGIKMSEKNLRYIKDLYEYMFPELKDGRTTAYDRGSNSDVAPYMDALMRTVAAVQGAINERIRLFEPVFKDELGLIPEDWMDAIEELDELLPEIRKIRVQPGGDGEPRVSETIANAGVTPVPSAYVPTVAPMAVAPQQVYNPMAPVAQPGMYPQAQPVNLNPFAQQYQQHQQPAFVYGGGGGKPLWD